jgi:hypothetical protein
MPLNLASPGIVIREVDLTSGRIDPVSASVAAIVAPFEKGPVDLPQVIETENDLLKTFGEPKSIDKHYEHWMTASSYLAYGGTMLVSRCDDPGLKNGFVGSASSVIIRSDEHYSQLGYDENTINGVTFAARNPGSWSNGIKVAIIDSQADQILSYTSTLPGGVTVGVGITQSLNGRILTGIGTTSVLTGYLKGVITGITSTATTFTANVKVLSYVEGTTETLVDYQPSGNFYFREDVATYFLDNDGDEINNTTPEDQYDWFDQQAITLSNSKANIAWNTLANRPGTSKYAADRNSRFDELHVVVIDDLGTITGNAGTILEKHLSLSKASDAEFSVGSPSNWRKYLFDASVYVFGGSSPTGIVTTGFTVTNDPATSFDLLSDTGWDQEASNIVFAGCGAKTLTLGGGKNYGGKSDITVAGALAPNLSKIITGYEKFGNTEEYRVDFILMGSANYDKDTAASLANQIISIAEQRKDAVAFISPYRRAFINDTAVGSVTVNSDDSITDNVIEYYASVTSSTYGVLDSGYKYMYDRFSNVFRYVPLNGDIAGTCARNDINQFPWFSPAGTARGSILNAVKLAYNPGKVQRDKLYSSRVNPVISSPGSGIILFGDKTAFGKSSAFDRINVRRLFIYLERAIAAAAKDQLFEFNDEITRTNFVNIVEPFLRDVQSKRGIFDYVVVCDETNNTAAVIDNNEFIADIYIKPARSINFIGLTFIATRTGIAFEEVIGNV